MFNDSSVITRTDDRPIEDQWAALALGADGNTFRATSGNAAYQFDLRSGAVLRSFHSSDSMFTAIAVAGEPRAGAGPPFAPAAVPALSGWLPGLLRVCIAGIAISRL